MDKNTRSNVGRDPSYYVNAAGELVSVDPEMEEFIFGIGKKDKGGSGGAPVVSAPSGGGGGDPYHDPGTGKFTGPGGSGAAPTSTPATGKAVGMTRDEYAAQAVKAAEKVKGKFLGPFEEAKVKKAAYAEYEKEGGTGKKTTLIQSLKESSAREAARKAAEPAPAAASSGEGGTLNTPSASGFMGKKVMIQRLGPNREATQEEIQKEFDVISKVAHEADHSRFHSKNFATDKATEAEVRARMLMQGTIASDSDVKKAIGDFWKQKRSQEFWGLVGLGFTADWLHHGFEGNGPLGIGFGKGRK